MGRTIKTIITILLTVFTSISFAQSQTECDVPDAPESTRIYFLNGIWTTSEKAKRHRNNLAAELQAIPSIDYGEVYVKSAGKYALEDLIEGTFQRAGEPNGWELLNNFPQSPEVFRAEYAGQIIPIQQPVDLLGVKLNLTHRQVHRPAKPGFLNTLHP